MPTLPFAPPTTDRDYPHLRACYRDSQLRSRWGVATPAFLAPMEGLTSEPIRRCFSRVGGLGVVCTEFVRIHNGTTFGEVKGARDEWLAAEIARGLLPTSKLSVQFMGDDPVKLAYAAQIAEEAGADFVDLNLGCPPKAGGRACAGSTMLKDENFPIALRVIRAMSSAVTRIPMTVKLRLGWSDPADLIRLTLAIEEAGASMVTIHGRTAEQKYSGVADWDRIGEAKARLRIPVLVNGDITDVAAVDDALGRSGADGVMIGRGALRNPWSVSHRTDTGHGDGLHAGHGPGLERHVEAARQPELHAGQTEERAQLLGRRGLQPAEAHHQPRRVLRQTGGLPPRLGFAVCYLRNDRQRPPRRAEGGPAFRPDRLRNCLTRPWPKRLHGRP
jgi:tRNA-dihydrouridine synthase